MIQINQLKIGVERQLTGQKELDALKSQAYKKISSALRRKKLRLSIALSDFEHIKIIKKSVDARKKDQVFYSYIVRASLKEKKEAAVLSAKLPDISMVAERSYRFQPCGQKQLSHPPVIVGMGPAGLFLGLMLSEAGYAPVILEQGGTVEERAQSVHTFWKTGVLDTACNVQFGEGGAGTFSDGKLNTMVKDTNGRIRLVLEQLVKYGADPEILYVSKPHIGTDQLQSIVINMRRRMQELGAHILFHTKMNGIKTEQGRIKSVIISRQNTDGKFRPAGEIPCEVLVPAVGHSARDTFELFLQNGLIMQPKPFAVGVRVEHPQEWLNQAQYGAAARYLPAADYKLTCKTPGGRDVYSFCMCPGGQVVNASSEKGGITVNGMSYHARNGRNANSAIVVAVSPEDFAVYGQGVLSGVAFQRHLEQAAFQCGRGKIPVQLYGDLRENKISTGFGLVQPDICGGISFANFGKCLPEIIVKAVLEGMEAFGRKIPGFDQPDAVFSGVEARTSSPVRIARDDTLQSNIRGIYPCGEGAGYAGGITSAAIDGIRIYEVIASDYKQPE